MLWIRLTSIARNAKLAFGSQQFLAASFLDLERVCVLNSVLMGIFYDSSWSEKDAHLHTLFI